MKSVFDISNAYFTSTSLRVVDWIRLASAASRSSDSTPLLQQLHASTSIPNRHTPLSALTIPQHTKHHKTTQKWPPNSACAPPNRPSANRLSTSAISRSAASHPPHRPPPQQAQTPKSSEMPPSSRKVSQNYGIPPSVPRRSTSGLPS